MDKELPVIPCKMIIEHVPSKKEIVTCLDSFLSSIKYRDDYTMKSSENDNTLTISFSNSKIAYDFLQEITYKKYNEEFFAKIKAELVFCQVKEYKRSQSEKATIASNDVASQKNNNQTERNDKFFTNKTPIRITAPYLDPQKKDFLEYQKNKESWVSKKPFFNSVNGRVLAMKEEFGTYVQRSPVNYAVVNYKHRDENKSKWIEKNGFKFKKALPDYIG